MGKRDYPYFFCLYAFLFSLLNRCPVNERDCNRTDCTDTNCNDYAIAFSIYRFYLCVCIVYLTLDLYIIALPNTVETGIGTGYVGVYVARNRFNSGYVCWIHVKSRCSKRFNCVLIFGIRWHTCTFVLSTNRFISRDLSYFFHFCLINFRKNRILRVKHLDGEKEKKIIGIKLVSRQYPRKLSKL